MYSKNEQAKFAGKEYMKNIVKFLKNTKMVIKLQVRLAYSKAKVIYTAIVYSCKFTGQLLFFKIDLDYYRGAMQIIKDHLDLSLSSPD